MNQRIPYHFQTFSLPQTTHTSTPAYTNTNSTNGASGSGSSSCTSTKEIEQVGANAAVLYGPDGEFVGDYRKTNLYTTDMTWARAGP